MKSKLLSFAVALAVSAHVFAQSDKSQLDNYFNVIEKNDKFMGNVLLAQDGKHLYSRSVGFADVQTKQKLDIDTRFRIGSITKMFTAALILKAVEEKKIGLDQKLSRYFPSVVNAEKITIEQLLGHRTGINNFTNSDDYQTWESTKKSKDEMVALISSKPSEFEPGTKADYSNSNYVLLSYILETVYKKSYGEILAEKILKPLKLSGTAYGSKINVSKNEALSYSNDGSWTLSGETDMSIPAGAGAIVSTTSDLAKFVEALFSGKVISIESLDKMKEIKDGYGLGMFRFPFDGKFGFGHTGGIDGFRSMLAYFPDSKITYVMLSNGVNYNPNNIGMTVLVWNEGKPVEIPSFETYQHTDDELASMEGEYSSPDMPLKITVVKKDKALMMQATGQPSFFPDPTARHQFRFDQAGLQMDFDPDKKEMKLKQGGAIYNFKKA
jgi:D-alanyl-D-alanine carboxypeptidase